MGVVSLLLGFPALAGDCFVEGKLTQKSLHSETKQVVAVVNGELWFVDPGNVDDFIDYFNVGDYVQICSSWGSLVIKNRSNGIQAVVSQ